MRLRSDRPVLELHKRWLLGKRVREVHLDLIASISVREDKDSDGDPVYYLDLVQRDGETVGLNSVAMHGRAEVDAVVERLRSWSGGKLATSTSATRLPDV